MAGMKGRSGGARIGAGRPRKAPLVRWLGGRGKGGARVGAGRPRKATAAVLPDGAVTCPKGLEADAAAVWDELATHALAERTLTVRTAAAFVWLCRLVVLERKLAAAPLAQAGPDHRGVMQRVEMALARFRLIPDGKPVLVVEQPQDEWSEFDRPLTVLPGGKRD